MKRKVLALVMTGIMALSCPVMAMAEEVLTLDYTMIDEDAFDGTWVSAFGVFDLYLPTDWDILVNAEEGEEPENGVYFQCANEDQTQSVAISYAQTDGLDMETYAAQLTDAGMEEVAFAVINDIPVITYSVKADGIETAGITVIGDQGGMYNVTLGAMEGDDTFTPIAQNIICSFSATEYEAETE